MKYLKKFATQAEYDAYVSGGMETPNVSLVEEIYTTFFTKKVVEEPEVIEYHFDIPMHLESSATGDIVENGTPNMLLNACGRVDGDFTELLNKLKALSNEYDELTEDIILERTNVTVNGYRMTTLWYYDKSQSWTGEECAEFVNESFETNGACANGIQIHPTYVSMEMYSLLFPNYPNWKEEPSEPEVLTYAFEIPMEEFEDSFWGPYLGGSVEGDYSSVYDNLVSFINKYGDGSSIPQEVFAEKVNITVNGDKACYMWNEPEYNQVSIGTDAPMCLGGGPVLYVTRTSLNYGRGK